VTAFSGNRDFYQVPLALHEHGLLERHISDFYTPNIAVPVAAHFARPFLSRRHPDLPSRFVECNLPAIWRQALDWRRKRDPILIAYEICHSLSLQAIETAQNTDAHLFLYGGIGFWAFEALQDRKRILFQFHPHQSAVYELLESDRTRHAEVRYSFETEVDSRPLSRLSVEMLTEWQLADHIVCASDFTRRSLVKVGCKTDRISVIPYGINLDTQTTSQLHERSSICKFLFVGQGVQRKGTHHLLKAWRKARLTNCQLTLVCYRVDPGIASLADQPGVSLLPKLSIDLLRKEFGNADVFVMPSIVEGFGLVYLEALAAGLYCVGTRNTGLPDLNPPSNVAAMIDAGDEAQLIEAMRSAAEQWRRQKIDRSAIREFAARRSWGDFRQDIATLIAHL
jgi:glycosyltransferase involved in cell wall biosynthesis